MNTPRLPSSLRLSRRATWLCLCLGFCCAALAVGVARAQTTDVGGIARDFTVTDRATGSPVHLTDFAGEVILLDFFAYWCGPCQVSSPDVEQNIHQYYDARGGNAQGVPVRVVSVNIESDNETATDQFIANAGLDGVVNDYAGSAYGQFDLGAIPLFVIISGVADSPSHQQWEVLYREAGYAGAPVLRGVIDSVEASDPTAPPRILRLPSAQTLPAGDPLRLEVRAGGARPLRYQWFRDDQALDGATNDVYQRLNAQVADSGSYLVEVANAFGTNRTPAVGVRVADPGSPRTFSYAGAPVAIPDYLPGGVTASIVVNEALEVLRLRISLRITHTWRGDLRVVLRSPGGVQAIVKEEDGSDFQADVVITGRSLAGLGGTAAQGTWRLQVADLFPGDTGRLESWSIEITPPASSLATAFTTWMQSFTSLTDPQRAAGADPDGDGVPNLLEYLLEGQSPDVANVGPRLTVPAAAPDYLEYAVTWRSGVDASGCKLWMCEGLGELAWREVTDRGTDIVVDRSDPGRLVVRCHRTLPRMFLQLRAEAAGL